MKTSLSSPEDSMDTLAADILLGIIGVITALGLIGVVGAFWSMGRAGNRKD